MQKWLAAVVLLALSDRYAAGNADFVPVAPVRIAVLAARSAAEDTGNQPRALLGVQGQSPGLVPALAQNRAGGPPQGGGQAGGRGGPPRPAAGHGIEVGGWWARLDNPKEPRTGLRFVQEGSALRATTGPTVILFDPEEDWEGPYTTKATLTMTKPASHEVAYGLFVGGQDLDTDKQRYTYFVVRQDGKFLIRKRTGAQTMNVGGDWADHAAIQKPNAQGSQRNELAIQVGRETVTFMANGQTVATHPAKAVDVVGISGLRIGHGLDVRIEGFSVTQGK